jgi:hypothetical protein
MDVKRGSYGVVYWINLAKSLYYGNKISDLKKCREIFDSTKVYWLSEESFITWR